MRCGLLAAVVVATLFLAVGSPRHHVNVGPSLTNSPGEENGRAAVLVELFTSEGCSSCPPADALLRRLDQAQPASSAELIVLSEHVDYWNDIGWTDPYSSHAYSERQSAYAAQFGNATVYTPQMVVDGRFEFVGSDERKASQAIREAAKEAKTVVDLSVVPGDQEAFILRVKVGPLPSGTRSVSADVFLALADNRDESQVSRGENAGRTLEHVAVLRKFSRIGSVGISGGFSREINLGPNTIEGADRRIIVIVQEPNAGPVLGVGLTRLSNQKSANP
jgi:Uncharacterized secreted protein